MASSPALYELVIPINQLSPIQLNQQSYGVNLLTALGILQADATTMWTQVNNFLSNFYTKLGITPTANQLAYMTNLQILLLVKTYQFFAGQFT